MRCKDCSHVRGYSYGVCQQSGIPAGRADAFPVELVGSETPEPAADMVEPTVVLGVFSDDDAPASVGSFRE
jgi:hypothetical protein